MKIKKLDIFILKSFLKIFVLTTAISNFILLMQYMLRYFEDIIGKNIGFFVFAKLMFYFSMNMLQMSLPLGVLMASLMTYGNLGEHFELTAIKSMGVSLPRTLRSTFIFIVALSIGAYFFNNYILPDVNLKAYSLIYDIKDAKPALDIKAGIFYNGLPNYSIKASTTLPDGKTLLDVIIYDHSNKKEKGIVILADSSIMYTIMDNHYLKLELYNGHYYSEERVSKNKIDRFYRTSYDKMAMVFSLESFGLKRRKEELFQNNRQMKNITELTHDIDSFTSMLIKQKTKLAETTLRYFKYHKYEIATLNKSKEILKKQDSLLAASIFPVSLVLQKIKGQKKAKEITDKKLNQNTEKNIEKQMNLNLLKQSKIKQSKILSKDEIIKQNKTKDQLQAYKIDTLQWKHLDSYLNTKFMRKKTLYSEAFTKAKDIKKNIDRSQKQIYRYQKNINLYMVEKYKKYAQSLACIIMFMIGAPLGAIIKKGGIGVPTILAILFFIIYYIFTSVGEKQAKENVMDPLLAVWMADLVLLPIGLVLLKQARIDARLFDMDAYRIRIEKFKQKFAKKNIKV